MIEKMKKAFAEIFGGDGEINVFFAPGRVNLIGEHTDCYGGHVFPAALTIGTYAAVRKRDDRKLRFYSLNFEQDGVIETSLDELVCDPKFGWTNYPKGVIWAFQEKGHTVPCGFDFVCFGNIPNKSGLSSSASMEVLTGKVLIDLFGFPVDMVQNALFGQRAENGYVGVNSGIMDQFASAMGKQDHAIFLNTNTLEYQYVPIHMPGKKIVIGNTNKSRTLDGSKYNQRRDEAEAAIAKLREVRPFQYLCELNLEEFEKLAPVIGNEVNARRARHVVSEDGRTLEAVRALEANDLKKFGELMNQSHISLRDNYEVTGIELDTMVEAAWAQEGVIGARMTGAGFGGCTVSIVEEDKVDKFIENVGKIYREKIGYDASFYVVDLGGGPVKLA